jgi:DMSO/TMAO reductase YedYZ molybdopterin-dependent catalytic subunit
LASVPATVAVSLVAAFAGWPSPLEAPAENLMEWTPVPVADFLLVHAASMSRVLALLGALALTMLAGGAAGALYGLTGRTGPYRLGGATLAAGLLWIVLVPVASPHLRMSEVWLVVGIVVILLLSGRVPSMPARRDFLLRSGVILGGAVALVALLAIRPMIRTLAATRLFDFQVSHGFAVTGLAPVVTPTEHFYVMDRVLEYPEVGLSGWRLVIDGAVARPLSLDFSSLLNHPRRNSYATLECVDNPVGGPMIGNALWSGSLLVDLLKKAGAFGDTVAFEAADDYVETAPRRLLEASGALIAYAMNGELLPRSHGYPARLVLPGIYGFKSVKWLTRIHVVNGPAGGDWQAHGWTETAIVHTMTRIDVADRNGNEVLLAGIAYAGQRGIRAVEVRANGGPWRRATLGSALSHGSWVQWATRMRGSAPATIEARAIDGTGRIQTARRRDAYPDGSTGWDSISI